MNYATIIMLVVMVGMIFFMQRQQRKQAQARQEQLNAVQKGDEIVTIGGMYAIVDEVDTANKKIVLDVDGVYLTYELGAIKSVVTKAGKSALTEVDQVEDQALAGQVDQEENTSAIEAD